MQCFLSEQHTLHNLKGEIFAGAEVPPFESPRRIDEVRAELRARGIGEICAPRDFGEEPICKVHAADYIAFLKEIWGEWRASGRAGEIQPSVWPSRSMPGRDTPPRDAEGKAGYYALAGETRIVEGTWEAAYWSAQCALSGAAAIGDGAGAAFAACRPPGHHAAADQFGGYCFINNAAVAAESLRAGGAARVAILDVDFHHGNGTQQIFYERGDVYYMSLHGDPDDAFPHFLGFADETGGGAGRGCNLNFPFPPQTTWKVWRNGLDEACKKIAEYRAEALVISLGVDAYREDPISFFRLDSDDFSEIGRIIARLHLPALFVMEGGYHMPTIGLNVCNVLQGFESEAAR